MDGVCPDCRGLLETFEDGEEYCPACLTFGLADWAEQQPNRTISEADLDYAYRVLGGSRVGGETNPKPKAED